MAAPALSVSLGSGHSSRWAKLHAMSSLDWSIKAFESAVEMFVKDLRAMEEDALLASAGHARAPIDFAFEVGLVNRHIGNRIKGEPSTLPNEGWIRAPSEFRTKAAVIDHLLASRDELLSGARAMSDGDKLVPTSEGETPVYDLVYFAATHTMYHDGQLNYIQAMSGDLAVHWS